MTPGSFYNGEGVLSEEEQNEEEQKGGFVKFGWIKGVLVSLTPSIMRVLIKCF